MAHLALCTSHQLKNECEVPVYSHLFSQTISQNSEVVAAVMCRTLQEEKARHPEINEAFYPRDCAGSYASGGLVVPTRISVGCLVSPSNAMIPQSHKQASDRVTGAPSSRNSLLTGFLMKGMI